jgi:hypothetical protein
MLARVGDIGLVFGGGRCGTAVGGGADGGRAGGAAGRGMREVPSLPEPRGRRGGRGHRRPGLERRGPADLGWWTAATGLLVLASSAGCCIHCGSGRRRCWSSPRSGSCSPISDCMPHHYPLLLLVGCALVVFIAEVLGTHVDPASADNRPLRITFSKTGDQASFPFPVGVSSRRGIPRRLGPTPPAVPGCGTPSGLPARDADSWCWAETDLNGPGRSSASAEEHNEMRNEDERDDAHESDPTSRRHARGPGP